jgi:uncharacterized lipoprotein YmbA
MKYCFTILAVALLLSSCHTSPENSYYTLSSESASAYPLKNKGISLRKATIPDILDRPQIVMNTTSNEIHILEYNRWAEPFEDMVNRVLCDDLTLQQTGNKTGKTHLIANHEITVTINQFLAGENGQVILKASWNDSGKTTSPYRFEQTATAEPGNINSVVSAMSVLLNALAHAILTSAK